MQSKQLGTLSTILIIWGLIASPECIKFSLITAQVFYSTEGRTNTTTRSIRYMKQKHAAGTISAKEIWQSTVIICCSDQSICGLQLWKLTLHRFSPTLCGFILSFIKNNQICQATGTYSGVGQCKMWTVLFVKKLRWHWKIWDSQKTYTHIHTHTHTHTHTYI